MSSLASPVLRLGAAGTPQPPQYLSEKYEFGRRLGGGAFGDVWLARERGGAQGLRAIKHIKQKYNRWEECLKLRECKALSSLPPHRNVVRLFQLIHAKPQLDLYFVMEYCPRDLHQLTTARRNHGAAFAVQEVAALAFDLLSALQHLHRHGFFHRDIKPENVLVAAPQTSQDTTNALPPELSIGALKLADFGQTREIRSRPPFTEYVSTRWYRAPEVLEGGGMYNSPVDIWGAGCVIGELMTCGTPIFPGQSVLQQLAMVRVARARAEDMQSEDMVGLPSGSAPDQWQPQGLQPCSTSPQGVDLLRSLLRYNQRARPNTAAALAHSFFDERRAVVAKSAADTASRVTTARPSEKAHAERATLEGEVDCAAAGVLPVIVRAVPPVEHASAVEPTSSASTMSGSTTMAVSSHKPRSPARTPTRPANDRVTQLMIEEAGIFSSPLSSSDVSSTPISGSDGGSGMRNRTSSEYILRKAFKKYDRKGTGFIDAHDVSRMLIKLGEFSNNGAAAGCAGAGAADRGGRTEVDSLTLMAAEAEVALADRSARGKLSYDDFVTWFTNRASPESGGSDGTSGSGQSTLPAVNSVSSRVAAARQLLMQSWDGSPTAAKGAGLGSGVSSNTPVSPTRPQRGSARRSPTRLRYRMPTSPSATVAATTTSGDCGSESSDATPIGMTTSPSSPSKRQLKEIPDKDKNGVEDVDPLWIAKRSAGPSSKVNAVKECGQENENSRVGERASVLSSPSGLFQKFDTSRTGFLTRKQFADMMVHLGLSFSSDDDLLVDAEMAMLADERDRVSFEQWKGWYENLPER